jgi:hypothetical protein
VRRNPVQITILSNCACGTRHFFPIERAWRCVICTIRNSIFGYDDNFRRIATAEAKIEKVTRDQSRTNTQLGAGVGICYLNHCQDGRFIHI